MSEVDTTAGWSSSGPPVSIATIREGASIKGAFVAMSVYKPETLPPSARAKGKFGGRR